MAIIGLANINRPASITPRPSIINARRATPPMRVNALPTREATLAIFAMPLIVPSPLRNHEKALNAHATGPSSRAKASCATPTPIASAPIAAAPASTVATNFG